MKLYWINCGDYGDCKVKAETKSKAKYKAFLQWQDAYCYRQRDAFRHFLSCIDFITEIPSVAAVAPLDTSPQSML